MIERWISLHYATAMSLSFTLRPPAPYSLERTSARLVRFPEVVNRFESGTYGRLLECGRALARLRVSQVGPASRPLLELRVDGNVPDNASTREAARVAADRILGTSTPVQPFYRAFDDDRLLAEPIRRFRGLRIAGSHDAWETLVTAVLSQLVNLTLAYRIRRDLAQAYGRRRRFDGESWIAFPRPGRIARETAAVLRKFGLSRAKAETILRLARLFASGQLEDAELRGLPDEQVIERLTEIRGVGRWTAEITLMRGLGRLDAFPGGDLGVVKYLAQGLLNRQGKASEAEMRRFAERWRPYRALALTYAYAELARQRKAPEALIRKPD